MRTATLRPLLLPLLAIAGTTALSPIAAASSAVPAVNVGYRDLDLNTAAGAQQLYRRIRGAARFVCGEEGRSLDEQAQWNHCVNEAVTDAVNAVHSPLLTRLDAGQTAPHLQTAQLRR